MIGAPAAEKSGWTGPAPITKKSAAPRCASAIVVHGTGVDTCEKLALWN